MPRPKAGDRGRSGRKGGRGRTLSRPPEADSAQRAERKEELLRPNPFLGYRHERLADHLMEREAYGLAEGQYRRMVWLNPYEPRFQEKLDLCLRLKQAAERQRRDR